MITVVVWLFFVAVISLYPAGDASRFPHADKALHLVLYALTTALVFSYLIKKTSFRKALVLSAVLPACYGIALELVQQYTGRSMSFWDGAVNTLGAAGAAVFIGMKRRWR
jgi:VanZ family protein